MARVTWATDASGDFAVASNWSGDAVPGPSDNAILLADGGADYTVTSTANETVNSISTAANATLVIDGNPFGSTFTATNGTGAGANRGTINVEGTSSFDVGGTFNNVGSVNLTGTDTQGSSGPFFAVSSGGLTLTGGGVLTETGGLGGDNIMGGALTNVDNTISGNPTIQTAGLQNEAGGTIDVSASGKEGSIIVGTTVVNSGLIEATGAAALLVISSSVNNTGGAVLAGDGTTVIVADTLTGGLWETQGSGVIEAGTTLESGSGPPTLGDWLFH